jgi:hypothetical protein
MQTLLETDPNCRIGLPNTSVDQATEHGHPNNEILPAPRHARTAVHEYTCMTATTGNGMYTGETICMNELLTTLMFGQANEIEMITHTSNTCKSTVNNKDKAPIALSCEGFRSCEKKQNASKPTKTYRCIHLHTTSTYRSVHTSTHIQHAWWRDSYIQEEGQGS